MNAVGYFLQVDRRRKTGALLKKMGNKKTASFTGGFAFYALDFYKS